MAVPSSSPLSIGVQLVLGLLAPMVIATAWVLVHLKGFTLFSAPTPQDLSWQYAGFTIAVVGYAGLFVVCFLLRTRWRVFAITGGVSGGLVLVIQLIDLFN